MTTELTQGAYYTMGENKRYRDRSWLSQVWCVLAANATHAVIQSLDTGASYRYGKEPQVVAIAEFDWTLADELAAALV